MAGDVIPGRAMIWSRTDRPARMLVRWSTREDFAPSRFSHPTSFKGPVCTAETDFTGRLELLGLPPDQQIFYEVTFEDAAARNAMSQPVRGSFRTAPSHRQRDVKLLWGGDVCGQGWGIDTARGGMVTFETMRRMQADLFVHSGDTIYADGPLVPEVKLPDGELWHNIVTPEKAKVAETLADFRGNHKYNLLDASVRRFNSGIAQVWQWDDHEVLNNWSSSKDLSGDPRYSEKNIATLVQRARKAFLEYAPVRFTPMAPERVYRKIPYGPRLDVFVIDMRSYRGPNNYNRETQETPFLGRPQVQWLLDGLRSSRATWKVIAADMPIGLQVGDGKDRQDRPMFENVANGNGPALGRELELARLLRELKQANVQNIVWLTADTHYTAAHHYHPDRAQFKDFLPFWEFMSGPLHAGTFGPGVTDDTFGIEVVYQKHPPAGQGGVGPSAGMQFFGEVQIAGASGDLTVTLRDMTGAALYTKTLRPTASA